MPTKIDPFKAPWPPGVDSRYVERDGKKYFQIREGSYGGTFVWLTVYAINGRQPIAHLMN